MFSSKSKRGFLIKKIEERLKEESGEAGVLEEELVLEALSKTPNEPLNPETRVKIHLKLSGKYIKRAKDFLYGRNYVQASGRAWGTAQVVKALAARGRG